jgi:uncharacterized membrane protein (DUF106 family)
MALFDFMNPILNLPPVVGILLISAIVSAITTIVYKYTTNQKMMKEIREDVKRMQAEIRATKDPAQMAKINQQMMSRSMQQLSSSMKSTLITLIPLFLLFGWMQTNYSYTPIGPGEEFIASAQFTQGTAPMNISLAASNGLQVLDNPIQVPNQNIAQWHLKAGSEGTYQLTYEYGTEKYIQPVIVTKDFKYANPVMTQQKGIKKGSSLIKLSVNLQPLRMFDGLSIFGWHPGWLATYIILSLIFSTLLRKALSVY